MALINWNDSFSVEIEEIDNQHKKLIEMINNLATAMKTGRGKVVLGDILNGLIDYTNVHFKFEEDYFDKFNYVNKEEHKKIHADFVNKILEFKEGFEKGNLFFSVELMNFLSDWLRGHIKGTDREYISFFHENGIH